MADKEKKGVHENQPKSGRFIESEVAKMERPAPWPDPPPPSPKQPKKD